MNWDEYGRLWVCETVDYPNELQTAEAQGRDKIKICEDTDNDGHADKFTVFAEHLSIPSALVCYRGGVIVQDGQTTVYMKDIDGDNKADFRQTLITGWGDGWTLTAVLAISNMAPITGSGPCRDTTTRSPSSTARRRCVFGKASGNSRFSKARRMRTAPAHAINKEGYVSSQQSSDFNGHTVRVEALEFLRATNNNTWGTRFQRGRLRLRVRRLMAVRACICRSRTDTLTRSQAGRQLRWRRYRPHINSSRLTNIFAKSTGTEVSRPVADRQSTPLVTTHRRGGTEFRWSVAPPGTW